MLSLIVLMVCLAGCGGDQLLARHASSVATFQFGGLTRSYRLHVPPAEPSGLVISLHGGGGTGAGQEALTDFDAVADAADLLVVYPDGYDKSWADGRGASPADRRHLDDVGFLVALAAKLVHDFDIAPGHVFATGMSNGGFMSNRLACDRADIFAAVAPVAGTLGVGVTCNPSTRWCRSTAGRCVVAAGSAIPSRLRAWWIAGGRSMGVRAIRRRRSCLTSGTEQWCTFSIPAHVRPAPR